jgi:hypothetical protein
MEVCVPAQQFVRGVQPHGFVEVDAARLLLVLDRFATAPDDEVRVLRCAARFVYERHFASEYYLQKLDFFLRYPRYFAFELIELHAAGDGPASNKAEAMGAVRAALSAGAPDLDTEPFFRFWRGAYERLDHVEPWWYSRSLVFTGREVRGDGPRWKHYFLTSKGIEIAGLLRAGVDQAAVYAARIEQIHHFMGHLRATQIKDRQYRHQPYREANLNQLIPDLSDRDIEENFQQVFGEPLGVDLG